MDGERVYSTRELAQMWNVSESTIKRWADAGELCCYRTPGGHRKFHLKDICSFQRKRAFEATGLLYTEKWEDPEIEDSLNRKRFDRVCELILYLGVQNQRSRIRELLERLYIRGMGLVDLYDDILVPVLNSGAQALVQGSISLGQERLLRHNVDEALGVLFPQLIRRRQNGRTGLCASPDDQCGFLVNGVSRVLEVEGWDSLNLGGRVPLKAMSSMVEDEPVNLVCVVSMGSKLPAKADFDTLFETAEGYRIPLVLAGPAFAEVKKRKSLPHDDYFPDFRSLQKYVARSSS